MPGLWGTTSPRGAASLRDCCWPIWWTGPIAETPPCGFSTRPKIPRHRMHPLFMSAAGRWEGLHALLKQQSMLKRIPLSPLTYSGTMLYLPAFPWHGLGFPGSWGVHHLVGTVLGTYLESHQPHLAQYLFSMWMSIFRPLPPLIKVGSKAAVIHCLFLHLPPHLSAHVYLVLTT